MPRTPAQVCCGLPNDLLRLQRAEDGQVGGLAGVHELEGSLLGPIGHQEGRSCKSLPVGTDISKPRHSDPGGPLEDRLALQGILLELGRRRRRLHCPCPEVLDVAPAELATAKELVQVPLLPQVELAKGQHHALPASSQLFLKPLLVKLQRGPDMGHLVCQSFGLLLPGHSCSALELVLQLNGQVDKPGCVLFHEQRLGDTASSTLALRPGLSSCSGELLEVQLPGTKVSWLLALQLGQLGLQGSSRFRRL
eukprot:15154857-Alexandrium_andersonii.AAC.1